jgi:hypothetical protein
MANVTVVVPNSGDVVDTTVVAVKRVLDGPGGIDRTGLTDLQCVQACVRLYLRGLFLDEKRRVAVLTNQAELDAAIATATTNATQIN